MRYGVNLGSSNGLAAVFNCASRNQFRTHAVLICSIFRSMLSIKKSIELIDLKDILIGSSTPRRTYNG